MQGFVIAATAAGIVVVAALGAQAAPLETAVSAAARAASRVEVRLDGETRSYAYSGLTDACGSISYWEPDREVETLRILDYATFGTSAERLIDARRAYFLLNAPRASGSHDALNILAFGSRAAARSAQQKLGGDLRDFEDAWKAAGEYWQPAVADAAPRSQSRNQARRVAGRAAPDCFT